MYKKNILGIAIHQGCKIPTGYGISYWLPYMDTAVCYPLGLNRIIRMFRNLYIWLVSGIKPNLYERTGFQNYQLGFEYGFQNGWEKRKAKNSQFWFNRGYSQCLTELKQYSENGGK